MALGRLGSYEILERVGQGGMGVVFRARDTRLDRVVALKVISNELASDPEYRARLVREARAEAALSHPNIATCFEIGEAAIDPPDLLDPGSSKPHPETVPFLAMEYVPGEDLLATLEHGPLPLARILEVTIQVAAALEAAHQGGVIHRDLKPSNIRVTPSGQVKILDFGLARVWESPAHAPSEPPSFHTSEGRIMGTVPYIAPEQARGRSVDARSDLFSFGVMLYQLVAGRLPFTGDTPLEVFYAAANLEPPPLARFANDIPVELERIARKLLAKLPEDRYQSAHEVLTDLRQLQDATRPTSIVHGRGATWTRRRRVAVAVGALALAVGAVVVVWRARGRLEPASKNVAVFEFENQSGDSTQDYVGSGLANEVQGDLVEHTDLNVASRAAAASLTPAERRPSAAARELGVGSILTGNFHRQDEGLRLDVELVNVPSGYVRWSAGYNFSMVELLRIKRDIVEQVASRLAAKLDYGSAGRSSGYPTHSLPAYDVYLQGVRQLEDSDNPAAPDRASELFGRALVLDPEFALAWAGRSGALLKIYQRDKRPEALRSAEQAADKAVQVEPSLLEGHIARARIYRATGRTTEAIAELKEVIRVRPGWDEAYVQLAATYRNAGMLPLAERSLRRAVELHPDNWRNWNPLGALLIKRGDYPGARKAFEQIVRLIPDKNLGYEQLAALAMLQNDFEQAVAQYGRLPTPVNDAALASNVGSAYFYTGRLKEAEEYYAMAVHLQPRTAVHRQNLGDCYLRMGLPDQAHACYREAVRLLEDAMRVDSTNVDLRFDRAVYLAKAGECSMAREALEKIGPKLEGAAASYAYSAAKVHGVCGDRVRAIAALRTAIGLGIPPGTARGEDEFRTLRGDPEFVRLTAGRATDPARPAHAAARDRP